MLHVRCGDDILGRLATLDIGPAIKWCDPVCEGPTPTGLRGPAWRTVRAHYLAGAYGRWTGADEAAIERTLAAEDRALLAGGMQGEVVLWFEADLFDQSILMTLLARFGACLSRSGRLSLVCIGDHPDVPRFIGLGQLSSGQLGGLLPQRTAIDEAQIALARRAWLAFTDPDPRAIEAVLKDDFSALPFLGDALRRHLAEFPDRRDGLGLTERLVLESLANSERSPGTLFRAVQDREARPWMGDLATWHIAESLAGGPTPLVDIDGPDDWWADSDTRLRITKDGLRVLRGAADRRAIAPGERWLGGVHLHPAGIDWRREGESGRIVIA